MCRRHRSNAGRKSFVFSWHKFASVSARMGCTCLVFKRYCWWGVWFAQHNLREVIFFTFLNWALSIVRLKKCFRSYRCHPGFTVVGVGVRVEMDPVHAQNYWMHPSLGKVLTARWHQAQGARKGQKVILTKDIISKSRTCCGSIKETLICFQGSRMGSAVKLTDVLTLWRNQTSILDPEGHPRAA